MPKTKISAQNKNKINSFHNSDEEEEDIYHPTINFVEKDDNYNHESTYIEDQDYNDTQISIFPIKVSQKIEYERFQDQQPFKINYFKNQQKKKSWYVILLKRRKQKQLKNTKQKTQELEQI